MKHAAVPGGAGRGMAWQGKARFLIQQPRRGEAGPGEARLGKARLGKVFIISTQGVYDA